MKYRHILMTLTALVALGAAVPLVLAQPARGESPRETYGPGMMGGGMMSGGMMGGMGLGPLQALDLDEQQQTRINQIRDETRRKNRETMGKLMDEQARLRDPATIGKQSMKMADLRRQLLEASIESHNRIEALLSKEQRDQLRSYRRGWMMGNDDRAQAMKPIGAHT